MIEQPVDVDFRVLADQTWQMVREPLRNGYLARGIDAGILDPSLDTVGAIYIRHRDTPPQTDPDPAKAAEQIEAWLRRLSLATLIESLEMEIETRRARLRD